MKIYYIFKRYYIAYRIAKILIRKDLKRKVEKMQISRASKLEVLLKRNCITSQEGREIFLAGLLVGIGFTLIRWGLEIYVHNL